MSNLTSIFGGEWAPPAEKYIAPAHEQLRDAIEMVGLTPPDQIYLDGKLHRFASGTKGGTGHGDKSGWYVAFGDGVPSGRFGDWRSMVESVWRADVGRPLSMGETMANSRRMVEAKATRDAEQEKKHEIAANVVDQIWSGGAAATTEQPYIKRKGIQPHGARVTGDGRLMVPLYDSDGVLCSIQYIDDTKGDGDKKYHPGGETLGNFWIIGTLETPGTIYIAEGFATAATVHEETGQPCYVAYSGCGLLPVAKMLREQTTNQDICIVADHDKSGTGQKYAEQACAKYGVRMVMPEMIGDANDYKMAGHNLAALLIQPTGAAVIDKLKAVFGDQLSTEYEAPDELVEGLMTIGSSVVVYGDSNSGKTFWALSVAAAIAMGTECYGRKTDPGLVVYLASESPASIRSRMQAIKKFYGCNLENLVMVPVPMNFYTGDQDARDVIELVRAVEQVRGQPVRLIIGDTLARMSAGANENSGEDMGPVMARFDLVAAATKAAMMIIHHNGKDAAKGSRGWSGIRAHIDTEIEVSEKDGIRSVSVTKQRELPGKGETIYFKLEVIEMGISKFGGTATTCVAIQDEDASKSQPHKKPSKHDENTRLLERAWWASGAEEKDGQPYITRSALRDLLVSDGMSERTAKNKTEASRPEGLIAPMLNSGDLQTVGQGWIFTNSVQVSSMLLRKHADQNRPNRP